MYEISSIILSLMILLGIKKMSSPETAVRGNCISAFSMLIAIILVLYYYNIVDVPLLWGGIALGGASGYVLARKVKMLEMPQAVALLNGLGGGASALVAVIEIIERFAAFSVFGKLNSLLAMIVGCLTFSGSLIAAGKLDRRLPQQPVAIEGSRVVFCLTMVSLAALVVLGVAAGSLVAIELLVILISSISLLYGGIFALQVGGADMPITISLLNSLSGLAGAICGLSVGNPLLVAVGAIVGASGLILTQIMCKAMNRSLIEVLSGATMTKREDYELTAADVKKAGKESKEAGEKESRKDVKEILAEATKVIIVPGYGMALAQAQSQVKVLFDKLEEKGKEVLFAIHPVAGRMPGHMHVLLAEADVPYDKLKEMEEINEQFAETDVAVVVGACDVINPAANTAEGTPIYGMPVLNVAEAKHVIVCNLDTKPGYSGVENSLYYMPHVHLLLGNAAETVKELSDF